VEVRVPNVFVHFICCSDLKKTVTRPFWFYAIDLAIDVASAEVRTILFVNSFLILFNIKSCVLNFTLFLRI